MRLRKLTDSEDWHPATFFHMAMDRDLWSCGVTWREWRLSALYTWYDGPIFQVRIGPFWVCLSYL